MKGGEWWITMGGHNAYIALTDAPDKKCPILGFIMQKTHGIHPCCWTKEGDYFGSKELADGAYHLSEANPIMAMPLKVGVEKVNPSTELDLIEENQRLRLLIKIHQDNKDKVLHELAKLESIAYAAEGLCNAIKLQINNNPDFEQFGIRKKYKELERLL
jgi:hypothetical protein